MCPVLDSQGLRTPVTVQNARAGFVFGQSQTSLIFRIPVFVAFFGESWC